MQAPTVNILTRMIRIETALGVGTAFTGEHQDEHFLFTARHVVGDDDPVKAKLLTHNRSLEASLARLTGLPSGVDIAVFPLSEPLTPTFPIALSPQG